MSWQQVTAHINTQSHLQALHGVSPQQAHAFVVVLCDLWIDAVDRIGVFADITNIFLYYYIKYSFYNTWHTDPSNRYCNVRTEVLHEW